MLREQGNLIDENIPITKELIEFAYANNYKISLKTGDYYQGEFRKDAFNYNVNLLSQLNDLYCVGDFYIGVYGIVFGFKKSDRWREVLRNNRLDTITGKKSKELYKSCVDAKRTETNLERYGAEYPFQSDEIQEKCRATILDKFGFLCALQNEQVRAKAIATWIENYGVDNPLKSEEVKEKIRQTLLERYGVNNPFKSAEIWNKMRNIWIEKYGVDNPLKSAVIQQKIRATLTERYGGVGFGSVYILNKARETWFENYGVGNPMKSPVVREKFKQSMIKKYGVHYAMLSDELKQRLFDSNILKYGVPCVFSLTRFRRNGDYSDEYAITRYNQLQNLIETGSNDLRSFLIDNYSDSAYYNYTREFEIRVVGKKSPSKIEVMFKGLLDRLGLDYQINIYKSFMRHPQTKRLRELDFFLPQFKIAFELNGEITHSAEYGVDADYHKFKYEQCARNGVKLVMLHERDFDDVKFIEDIIKHHIFGDIVEVEDIDLMRLAMCDLEHYCNLDNSMLILPVGKHHHWYPVKGVKF